MWFFNRKVETMKIICKECNQEFEKYPAEMRDLCDKCFEEEVEKQRIEREEKYCKDREHNYLGTYHIEYGMIVWVCSKCGKEL